MENKSEKLRNASVTFFIILNILVLVYFKYSNFFISTLHDLSGMSLPNSSLLIPLGVSFFTFSGISYLLDLKSGKANIEKNIITFSLFISFFPKLLQGPIARFGDVASQIRGRTYSVEKFSSGSYRFVVGLAKKVILADQIGLMVDHIFTIPAANHSVSVAWLGAFAYSMQIFFDFSGYTDMAIGLGKMFGFDLPENFNAPYISKSITEF